MILQVHDELVFDVPESEKEIFEQLIRDSMERIFAIQNLRKIPENMCEVKIIVDIGKGKTWTDAK